MWKILLLLVILIVCLVIFQLFYGSLPGIRVEGLSGITPAAAAGPASKPTTIYSSPPSWATPPPPSKVTTSSSPDASISSAIAALATYPPNLSQAISDIQTAIRTQTANYNANPSQVYITGIHQLTAALNDLQGTPVNISDAMVQLKGAVTTFKSLPGPLPQTQNPVQQNCFNQTYANINCPQSVIETYSASLSTFNRANATFIQCLQNTNNPQYTTLLGKLNQIQSILNSL